MIHALVQLALLIAIVALLVRVRSRLQYTTLLPAWSWTLAAATIPAIVELWGFASDSSQILLAPWRCLAAMLSLCPVVAQLGAKRPQHQPWNFIVVSLWGVLALPAFETLILHPGQAMKLSDTRSWFVVILLLIAPGNLLATRFTLAALLAIAGQVILLLPILPWRIATASPQLTTISMSLWLVAIVLAMRTSPAKAHSTWDRLWLDFRDQFGLLWGLRLQERVNTTAEQLAWPIELTWSGFVDRQSQQPLSDVDLARIDSLSHNVRGLLRRFVTQEWISERQQENIQSTKLQTSS